MQLCDWTLPTPEENLACDEVLLDRCESGVCGEILRFWEAAQYFVVVGYGNAVRSEVDLEFCTTQTIPVLRRCSGGGTVLQGPGCLNYSLILDTAGNGQLSGISATNDFVMQRHQEALSHLLQVPVERAGHTDLAIGRLKFSGNAQRRKKRFLLFHGCFLLHLDIDLVEKCLPLPTRQPKYRLNRSHSDFLVNLKLGSKLLKTTLVKAWGAKEISVALPFEDVSRLAGEKYSLPEWNFKF